MNEFSKYTENIRSGRIDAEMLMREGSDGSVNVSFTGRAERASESKKPGHS